MTKDLASLQPTKAQQQKYLDTEGFIKAIQFELDKHIVI